MKIKAVISKRIRLASQVGYLLLLSTLAGCVSQHASSLGAALDGHDQDAAACATALAAEPQARASALDASSIRVVNWNIRKGSKPAWATDLQALAPAADIILLQEASPDLHAMGRLSEVHYISFAEGYSNSKVRTGVMTLSRAEPLNECRLIAREPWLGTPKAMLVTNYDIVGSEKSLLVINIHGVNFSINARELAAQIRDAESIIGTHSGPVLFSGDFNTWRSGRARLLEEAASRLGLKSLSYKADYRKRVMGIPLDHIYTRGLVAVAATSLQLTSSDHNPLIAELRLESAAGRGVSIRP